MGLAKINIVFTADLRGFSTEMQNSMRRIGQFGSKMTELGKGMSVYVTGPLVAGGAAAIKFASDYNESLNKVDVAFGNHADTVKDFAKTTLESFGIAESTALDMASTYGDMATSMGLPTEKAAKMSETLVGLAGDLSSFKNIGIDQANTALSGIFTGETESLKKLGIVITEANLQSFALSRGIKVNMTTMDQASKVNLRYAYIMDATKNAQGDFIRTGGGAANQMRIFQESLKQVAQQFGSVMIPAFTKAIVYVNGLIKSFGNLNQGTKETIVVVAAVVASIGPLLTVFGSLLTFVPNLITKFNALKDAFVGIGTVIAANPYTALAVAIAAIALATYAWYSNTEKVLTGQEALNKAVAEGNKNAATEIGTLDKLYASATNVKLSVEDRKDAVKKLQELYPAYFQNLDQENIKNGKAVTVYNELRDAIFNKARAVAVDLELQNRANSRIQKELELRDNIAKTEAEIVRLKKGANEIVVQEASASERTARIVVTKSELIAAQTKLLKIQQDNLSSYNKTNRESDEALFKAKEEFSAKSGKLSENEALKLDAVSGALEGVKVASEDVVKVGTIEFYQNQIKDLEALQNSVATTSEEYSRFADKITGLQLKIDKISQSPKLAPIGIKVDDKFDPKSLIAISGGFEKLVTEMQSKAGGLQAVSASMKTTMVDLTATVNTAIEGLAESAAVGLGEAVGGIISGTSSMADAMSGMLGLVGSFMKELGKSLIAAGIAAEAFKKLTAHPFLAIAAGIALVALGSVVQNKFNAGPKFENGGIVGGSSYYGDKIMARVNSAEMISNTDQQKRIWGAMNSGGGSQGGFVASTVVKGSDMLIVIERATERKNRKG